MGRSNTSPSRALFMNILDVTNHSTTNSTSGDDDDAFHLTGGETAAISLGVIVLTLGLMIYALKRLMMVIEDGLQHVRWRVDGTDSFRAANGYGTDWIFVAPIVPASVQPTPYQRENSVKALIEVMTKAGFQTRCYYSHARDKAFIKIRAKQQVLGNCADDIDYPMKLHTKRLLCRLAKGMKCEGWDHALRKAKNDPKEALHILKRPSEWIWLPVDVDNIDPKRRMCKYGYTDFIYGKFDNKPSLRDLYKERRTHIFGGVDRIRLIRSRLQGKVLNGGAELNLQELVDKEALVAVFPAHDQTELRYLKRRWLVLWEWPMKQPFDEIRDYFGEKLAMYFLWLGTYCRWLFVASFAGVVAYVADAAEGFKSDSFADVAFACFMCLWSTAFMEAFKRNEVVKAFEWGMIGFEDAEQLRPQFDPAANEDIVVLEHSAWNGKREFYYPSSKRRCRKYISATVIFLLTLIVVLLVAVVDSFKAMTTEGGALVSFVTVASMNLGSTLASVGNAVCIAMMSTAFDQIAPRLTENENHKTDTKHESSLIGKLFAFNFVNSYAALTYVAFFEHNIFGIPCSDEDPTNCIAVLGSTLQTLIITKLIVGNIQEVVLPAYATHKKIKVLEAETRATAHLAGMSELDSAAFAAPEPVTVYEEEFLMPDYDIQTALKDDYLEMVIQYGYVCLFSVTLPLAPVLALVSNYIEIRVDAWKITSNSRRPFPQGAEGIGIWRRILSFISLAGIITNGLLICFTSTVFEHRSMVSRFGIFIIIEHALVLNQMLIAFLVEDVPADVKTQLERQKFIVERVIDNTEDDALDIALAPGTAIKDHRKKYLHPKHKDIYFTDHEYMLKDEGPRGSMGKRNSSLTYTALAQDDNEDTSEIRRRSVHKNRHIYAPLGEDINPSKSAQGEDAFLSVAATPLLEDMMPSEESALSPPSRQNARRGWRTSQLGGYIQVAEAEQYDEDEALSLEKMVQNDEAHSLEHILGQKQPSSSSSSHPPSKEE